MPISSLIAALLPILLGQALPALIADIEALIKGNPQNQGESDQDYIARLTAGIVSTDKTIQADNQAIQN